MPDGFLSSAEGRCLGTAHEGVRVGHDRRGYELGLADAGHRVDNGLRAGHVRPFASLANGQAPLAARPLPESWLRAVVLAFAAFEGDEVEAPRAKASVAATKARVMGAMREDEGKGPSRTSPKKRAAQPEICSVGR